MQIKIMVKIKYQFLIKLFIKNKIKKMMNKIKIIIRIKIHLKTHKLVKNHIRKVKIYFVNHQENEPNRIQIKIKKKLIIHNNKSMRK